ncbi:MAG: TRAP transporter small permease subunit [Aestuariivirgaceae bacterium]
MSRTRPAWAAWVGKAGLLLAFQSGIAMLLMMFAGSLDIVGTNVFGRPVPAAFEFMATMMVVVVFFALSLAQARKAHLRVEVVYNHMPALLQYIVDIIQYVVTTAFFGLIGYFGWKAAALGFAQGEYASGIVNFPIWPARFALAIGASLMTLQCLFDLIGHILGWQVDDSDDSSLGKPV